MPELISPDERVRESFVAAMAEFRAEGRGDADDTTMLGHDIWRHAPKWSTSEGFRVFARMLRDQSLEEAPRPMGFVPCTTLWWVEGDEFLGRIAIRHRLNPKLRELGGHIGYDVRPSARRQGHATAMLRAALSIARQLGIEAALLTCDTTNTASRRVIELNGGVLEDQTDQHLFFWVPTQPRSPIISGDDLAGNVSL